MVQNGKLQLSHEIIYFSHSIIQMKLFFILIASTCYCFEEFNQLKRERRDLIGFNRNGNNIFQHRQMGGQRRSNDQGEFCNQKFNAECDFYIFSVDYQKMYDEEQLKAKLVLEEKQKQLFQNEVNRLQRKLSQYKQICRCRFGFCNGTFLSAFWNAINSDLTDESLGPRFECEEMLRIDSIFESGRFQFKMQQ